MGLFRYHAVHAVSCMGGLVAGISLIKLELEGLYFTSIICSGSVESKPVYRSAEGFRDTLVQ